jgi:hypothetical protein
VTNHFAFDEDVTGGQFAVKVAALGGIPLKHQTGPLCGIDTSYDVYLAVVKVATVTIYGSTCPIARGPADVKYDIKLLSILPPVLGDASFHLTAKDQKGTDIFCVQAKLGIQLEDNVDAETADTYMKAVEMLANSNNAAEMIGTNPTHYGDPKTGCESDEQATRVQGFSGDFCSPTDVPGQCPTDVPSGVTAKPGCAYKTTTGMCAICALICTPSALQSNGANCECGTGTCQSIQGQGLCTYAAAKTDNLSVQAGECLQGYYGQCHPEALSSQPLLAPRYPSCSRCCHGFYLHRDHMTSWYACTYYHVSGSEDGNSKAVKMLSAPVLAAPAGISLKHSDCGGKGSHAPIVDFGPSEVALGNKTTMVGHGKLDETVKSANFDLTMTGALGTMLHCSGDASITKSCPLPMGFGSLTMQGMSFPLQPGNAQ